MGIVSHDLRNPLSAIQLSADVLARASCRRASSKALGRISQLDRSGRSA